MSCPVIWNPLELMISNYQKTPVWNKEFLGCPGVRGVYLLQCILSLASIRRQRDSNLVNTDLGQREHWKKVNKTIKKRVQTGQPFCPDSLKTILTVQLTNQAKNIILHGTYLNNHTCTSFKNFWIHKHFKDEADFWVQSLAESQLSWLCKIFSSYHLSVLCFVEPSVLKIFT